MKELSEEKIIELIIRSEANKLKEMNMKYFQDSEPGRKEFEEYLDVWEKSAEAGTFEKIDTARDWQKVRSKIRIKSNRKRIPIKTYFLRIAAILILALGLAYLLTELMDLSSPTSSDYLELTAETQNTLLELPDGSQIYLNKDAKVIRNSDFGISNRDIILEGEAFFEVARNENLPFKVHTLNATVEVLGTSFNVKSTTDRVSVGVLSGKVAFYSSEDKTKRLELEKNNSGFYSGKDISFVKEELLDINELVWHTGEFRFEGSPVNEVCQTLAGYFNLETDFDENLELSEKIQGSFPSASLQEIILQLNNSVTEDLEIIATSEMLIIRKN